MKQGLIIIENEQISYVDQICLELFDLKREQFESESRYYYQLIQHHTDRKVANLFKDLVENQIEKIQSTVIFHNKNDKFIIFDIHGHRVEMNGRTQIIGTISDMRQKHQQLNNVLKELNHFKYALDQSAIVAITDKRGIITYVNDMFCAISGYSEKELLGKTHRMINSSYHPHSFFKGLWKTISSGNVWKSEIRNQKNDGTYYWVDTTIVPLLDGEGKIHQYLSIRFDITEKKGQEEQIRTMAFYDHLTGLASRRLFDKLLNEKIDFAKENQKKFGLIFIDLDRFKNINDMLGHLNGDRLLIEVSERLNHLIGNRGTVARLGGDEFAIIVNHICGQEQTVTLARDILDVFNQPFYIGQFELHVTCSIGVAMYPESGETSEVLMRHADTAMYHVKREQKNNFQLFNVEMNKQNQRTFQLQNDLRKALAENQFTIVYQPRIEPRNRKVTSCEALLRWNHPEYGEILPGEFILFAEEMGFIHSLGSWVLQSVCKQIQQWASKGYDLMPISINLSVSQFMQTDFLDQFLHVLKEYNVNPKWIQVEITESLLIENEERVKYVLQSLRKEGIKIVLDDFGTGYSSLAYLRKFQIDTLKIDKGLIEGISIDSKDKEIVSAVIQLGKNLGMLVAAEGVAEEEELQALMELGIDEVQGFYFCQAVRVEKMEEMLRTKKCILNK